MTANVKVYAQILRTARDLEAGLGVTKLSNPERLTLISISEVSERSGNGASLDDILSNVELADMPPATFYRSLKSLQRKGLIKHLGSKRSGLYELG